MIIFRKIVNYLINNIIRVSLVYYLLISINIFYHNFTSFNSINIIYLLIILFISSLFYEMFLRILLFIGYGKNYKYLIFNYFLVDDKYYGYSFKRLSSSKRTPFFLFDNFIFYNLISVKSDLKINKQNRVDFNINSLGFRGPEFEKKKKSKFSRIFCSGGSTTAGSGVDDSQTWPHYLGKELSNKGYEVEVINSGVHGWNSFNELQRFKKEIINYNIDVLLIHQGWNEEFNYSSLGLGKKWSNDLLRNTVESLHFYCNKQPLIKNFNSIFLFLLFQRYYQNYVFYPQMSFHNSSRWDILQNNDYLLSWFDNQIEFAKLCLENNILIYNIDYPSLVSMNDEEVIRKEYITHYDRLSLEFADYQAISKKRISKFLQDMNMVIPIIDANKPFNTIDHRHKMKLFLDEIHMNEKGNKILAHEISDNLIKDKDFNKKYNKVFSISNIDEKNIVGGTLEQLKNTICKNHSFVDRFIDNKKIKLKLKNINDENLKNDIPSNRYTTF